MAFGADLHRGNLLYIRVPVNKNTTLGKTFLLTSHPAKGYDLDVGSVQYHRDQLNDPPLTLTLGSKTELRGDKKFGLDALPPSIALRNRVSDYQLT